MYYIKNKEKNELIIKNSKFIAYAFPLEKEEDIKNNIELLNKNYKDYTHLVYAYKFNGKQKAIDDNEPSGTAGPPILEVINKNHLENTLIVVIRYFGGIKLGAGGLIRAYSKSAREVLSLTEKEIYIEYNYYELKTNYDNLKLLNTLTNGLNIISKNFSNDIIYKIKIEKDKDTIKETFQNTDIQIQKTKDKI